ncbi:hypothetical protein GZL_09197 [Streptomyces sp. 769]|nr:hypothetical protein GZL_09197 [Streptomyces sp. 769]
MSRKAERTEETGATEETEETEEIGKRRSGAERTGHLSASSR